MPYFPLVSAPALVGRRVARRLRDLHGTKDRPPKQFEREEQRLKYEALEAAREAERATAAGAGPSSYGGVDIEQPAVTGGRGEVKQRV